MKNGFLTDKINAYLHSIHLIPLDLYLYFSNLSNKIGVLDDTGFTEAYLTKDTQHHANVQALT